MSEPIPTTGPISPEIRAAGQLLIEMHTAWWDQVKAPLKPVLDLFEADPERFEQMCADLKREREAEQAQQSCHCLCGMHRDQGMNCTGIATTHRRLTSPTVGTVDVPMCEPCEDCSRGNCATCGTHGCADGCTACGGGCYCHCTCQTMRSDPT